MRVNQISSGFSAYRKNNQYKKIQNLSFEMKQPLVKEDWIANFFNGLWKGWIEACKIMEGCSGSFY